MMDSKTAATAWYEALERDDLPATVALCAPDVEINYPGEGRLPYGGTWRGPDGVEGWAAAHDEAEEIVSFRVDGLVAEGRRVVALGFFGGRARDTGRAWQTRFVHVLDVQDGRLRSLEAYFDTAAALEAHGG